MSYRSTVIFSDNMQYANVFKRTFKTAADDMTNLKLTRVMDVRETRMIAKLTELKSS